MMYQEELRIAFASLLEEPTTISKARRIYNIPGDEWRKLHIPKLIKMGLLRIEGQRVYPLQTPQAFIFAYTDTDWEVCKKLTDEECKEVAREFLRLHKSRDLEDFLYS